MTQTDSKTPQGDQLLEGIPMRRNTHESDCIHTIRLTGTSTQDTKRATSSSLWSTAAKTDELGGELDAGNSPRQVRLT
jgi:hypothetical protein